MSLPIQLYSFLKTVYPIIAIIAIYEMIIILILICIIGHLIKKKKNTFVICQNPSPPPIEESKIDSLQVLGPELLLTPEAPQLDPPERYALFVDSKNLYLSIKDMLAPTIPSGKYSVETFNKVIEDLEGFVLGRGLRVVEFLKDVVGGRNCPIKKYYRGYPLIPLGEENPMTVKYKEDRRKFINFLIKNGFDVPIGGVEVKIHGRRQEKGVDTLLTMDVLEGAINNTYDTAIIISSDRDFIPLVRRINEYPYKKRFIYVTFANNISRDMQRIAYRTKIYSNEEINKFIKIPQTRNMPITKD